MKNAQPFLAGHAGDDMGLGKVMQAYLQCVYMIDCHCTSILKQYLSSVVKNEHWCCRPCSALHFWLACLPVVS